MPSIAKIEPPTVEGPHSHVRVLSALHAPTEHASDPSVISE